MDQDPGYTIPRQHIPTFTSSHNGKFQTFTFDDILVHQYRNHKHEMTRWINTKLQKPGVTIHQVLSNFVSYFTSDLREWLIALAQYRQIQLL